MSGMSIPKDVKANLALRAKIADRAAHDGKFARHLLEMCERDCLLWINLFCWTSDPRLDQTDLPFVTYTEFQDSTIRQIEEAIDEQKDLCIDKSRDMGVSWMVLAVILHRWLFRNGQNFLIGSRKEELVDSTESPECLFWKLMYVLEKLPAWMKPTFHKTFANLKNVDRGGVIGGESTNKDFARAGRMRAIFLDEMASMENGWDIMASTSQSSRCRIMVSTPKGSGNEFYEQAKNGKCKNCLSLHWTLHPLKREGLYYDSAGKPRSPWYDRECERLGDPQQIGQELDISYTSSDYQFFDEEILRRIRTMDVRDPVFVGRLEYDTHSYRPLRLVADPGGPLRLWINPDGNGTIPGGLLGTVSCGVDIATGAADASGRGRTNSTASFGDCRTGEKFGELVINGMQPHDFAGVVVACCRMFPEPEFDGAYLIWEHNGPGGVFANTVIQVCGYGRFYCRKNDESLSANVTDLPGFWSNANTKKALLGEYKRAIQTGECVVHSLRSVEEARAYVYGPSGSVYHSAALRTHDPSGARENHGDMVIADALMWKGMDGRRPRMEAPAAQPIVKVGSLAWRMEMAKTTKRLDELTNQGWLS